MARRRDNEAFRLFKRNGTYYARYLDEHGRVYATRSTGETAKDRAWKWAVANGQHVAEGRSARNALLLDYLADFWSPDSPRSRDRALSGKSFSAGYIEGMARIVRLHVAPWRGWQKIRLNDVTPKMLTDFKRHLGDDGKKRRTMNLALDTVTVALRWAQKHGDLSTGYDFSIVGHLHDAPAERGILTEKEVRAIVALDWPDPRQKAAILLGLFAGFRRGEMMGLCWRAVDLDGGTIRVEQAVTREGETKAPKAGSYRTVPITEPVEAILRTLKEKYPYGDPLPDDYVLCATPWRTDSGKKAPSDIDEYRGRPIAEITLRRGWFDILAAVGIDEEERARRRLVLHGCRHYFAKVVTGRLPLLVAQRLMGHRSAQMTEHYASHETAEDVERARKVLKFG